MIRTFLDPRDEAPALRRAAILLERALEDGADEEFAELQAGVATLQRAAAAGRLVHHSAIDRMIATLSRLVPLSCGRGASIGQIVRCNALMEARELLDRLAASGAVAAGVRESATHHIVV
jgi:hypothetical protein